MPTVNVSTIAGDSTPCVQRAEDLGSGSADNVSGKILAIHRHDAIFMGVWNTLHGVGLTKNYFTGTVASSGDNTAIAAPGSGNRLSIAYLSLGNESATEVTVIIKSGATNRWRGVLSPKGSAGSFREISFPVHMPLDLVANNALVVNLSAAVSVGVNAYYFVRT
jgi:hypothetical protein